MCLNELVLQSDRLKLVLSVLLLGMMLMRQDFWRSSLAILSLAGTLIIALSQPAQAETLPTMQYSPVDITDMANPVTLTSQSDGGLTIGCSVGTGTKRISSSGEVTQNITFSSEPYPSACPRTVAVAQDGTLFTTADRNNGQPIIQAIKDSVIKWSYPYSCLVVVRGMVIGTNGNLYALSTGLLSPCNGQNMLIGFAPTAEGASPTIVLNMSVSGNFLDGGISAYDDGLVLRTTTGIQYVTYAGESEQEFTVDNIVNNGQIYHNSTLAGRTFVPVRATQLNVQLCGNDSWVVSSLYAIEPSGGVWSYSSFPACSHVNQEVEPTPTGGVVIRYSAPQGGIPGNTREEHLLALDSNGKKLWQIEVALPDTSISVASMVFAVDNNGNVAVQRLLKYRLAANGAAYYSPAVQLQLVNGRTGIITGLYEFSGDHTSSSSAGYDWYGGNFTISISHGTWYVSILNCASWKNCTASSAKLYAVKVPGLQMDYPRAAIVSPVATFNYAALGDSYSSGEGVPPFINGTDTGSNNCHRSDGAYGSLLNETPSLGWKFTMVNGQSSFVACSGAKIDNVAKMRQFENFQTVALNENTDVITISIGGNDVPFQDFVTLCLFSDCSDAANNQDYFANIEQIESSLTDLYGEDGAIHTSAPNAKIYVLGYPQLLPTQGCAQTNGWMSTFNSLTVAAHSGDLVSTGIVAQIGNKAGFSSSQVDALIASGVVEFNQNEVDTARLLVQQLDQAIKDAVALVNQSWLVYIDPLDDNSPFTGHELCTSQPYFNGLTVNLGDIDHDLKYSYHPNSLGQSAYQQLILQQL